MLLYCWIVILLIAGAEAGTCWERSDKLSIESAETLCRCASNGTYSDKDRMQFALDALGEIDNIYTARKKLCANKTTAAHCEDNWSSKDLSRLLGQIPRVLMENTTTVHSMRYTGTHYHLEARNGTWVHMSFRYMNISVTADAARTMSIVVFSNPTDADNEIGLQVSTNVASGNLLVAISGLNSVATHTLWASSLCRSYWKDDTLFSNCDAEGRDTPLLLSTRNLYTVPPGIFVVLIVFLITCSVLYCLSKQSRTGSISILDKVRHYFWQSADTESDDELSDRPAQHNPPNLTLVTSDCEMSSLSSNGDTNPFIAFQGTVPVPVPRQPEVNPLLAAAPSPQPPGPPPLQGCDFGEMMRGINTAARDDDSDTPPFQKQPPGPPPLSGCDFREMMKGINTAERYDTESEDSSSPFMSFQSGIPPPVPHQPPGPPALQGCDFGEMMKGINTAARDDDSDTPLFPQKQPPGPPPLPGCDFGEMMKGINRSNSRSMKDDDSDTTKTPPLRATLPKAMTLDSSFESHQSRPWLTPSKSEEKAALGRTQTSDDSDPIVAVSEQLNLSHNSNLSATRGSSFQEFSNACHPGVSVIMDPFADDTSSELSFSSLKGANSGPGNAGLYLNPPPVPPPVAEDDSSKKMLAFSLQSSFGGGSRPPQFTNFNDMLMSDCVDDDSSEGSPSRKLSSNSNQSSPPRRAGRQRQSVTSENSQTKSVRSRKVHSCEFPNPSSFMSADFDDDITSERTPIIPPEGTPRHSTSSTKRGWHPRSSSGTLQGIIDMLPKISAPSREVEAVPASSPESQMIPPPPPGTGQFLNFLNGTDYTDTSTEDSDDGMEC
eukprot:TRINITY_DN549_c0_g2_i1.p1 TRINITY_DN549_c0_g2~~TRINITY_DN549_c0_g2_i1.p1  ORF type:complete len:831 (+),score=165.49 TRINITY_DN549_c0_g2_i1:210-2702(+)